MLVHSLLASQCELGTGSLCAEGVHAPVKPETFKMNAGAYEGTITTSFLYGPECTHRLNRCKLGGITGLTGVCRKVLLAFSPTDILVVKAIYTPSNALIQYSWHSRSFIHIQEVESHPKHSRSSLVVV